MKPLWGAGVQQAQGDFKRYRPNKINYNAIEVFIMRYVYWFHDNEEILLSIVSYLPCIEGRIPYRQKKKKKWKGYHSTPVHTISWSIILSDTYRISHGLWCDMIFIQRVVCFLSPSLGNSMDKNHITSQ
jgi:hypothetical protein